MSIGKVDKSKKASIAIKAGRTAAGLNQTEFAKLISVSRITLARLENLENPIKLEVYFDAVRELKALGIEIDATTGEDVLIRVTPDGQRRVVEGMGSSSKR